MPSYYINKRKFKVYSIEDIKPYLQTTENKPFRALFALAFLTGARIGELILLRRKDFTIDERNDEILIVLKTLKRKDSFNRELIFSIKADPFVQNTILPFIRQIEDGEEKIFPMSKRLYQMKLLKMNKAIHGENKKDYITFHQLRHSAITFLARDLRASIWEIESWTGHKSSAYEEYMIHGATKRFKGKMIR